jgi:hypothetical protein
MLRQTMVVVCCLAVAMTMVSSSRGAEPSGVRQVSHHAGCGCDRHPGPVVPVRSCATCRPCCPPLIPALLQGVDRLLQRIFCCSSCGSRCLTVGTLHAPTCGCDAPVVDRGYSAEYPIMMEQHGAVVPAPNQHYAPAHKRPVPKRNIRETQLEGHSIIKRTSYKTQAGGRSPARLNPVSGRPVPAVRRIPTAEQASSRVTSRPQPKAPVKLHNPLRD